MILQLDNEEKKLALRLLIQLAIEASQAGDRGLHREIMRIANKFTPNTLKTRIKKHEAKLLREMAMKTKESIETDVLPKLETSEKTDKEEKLAELRNILATCQLLFSKLESKLTP